LRYLTPISEGFVCAAERELSGLYTLGLVYWAGRDVRHPRFEEERRETHTYDPVRRNRGRGLDSCRRRADGSFGGSFARRIGVLSRGGRSRSGRNPGRRHRSAHPAGTRAHLADVGACHV